MLKQWEIGHFHRRFFEHFKIYYYLIWHINMFADVSSIDFRGLDVKSWSHMSVTGR